MITGLPDVHIVLVNPGVEMPTPAVFKALATRQNPPMPDALPDWPDARALADWLKTQRNDLEKPALAIAPEIGDVLAALAAQPGALIARMSGSGATCFALFETSTAAKAAADAIGAAQPTWWAASGPVYCGNRDWTQLIRATT
jgi:4-diphosphocytidyl-2-C-methyl-D-erythritol kinase